MAKEDSTLSGVRLAQIKSDGISPSILEDDVEKQTSTELVLYKGSDKGKQFPATWKEHWRDQHGNPLWTDYNKESYKIVPFPTLASGKPSSEKPGYHYKVQIRSRPDAFTCCPKLPTELRLQIWRHTLPAPQVVQVLIEWVEPFPQPEQRNYLTCCLIPNKAFGSQWLLACRESAAIFREAYSQVTISGVVSQGMGVFYKPGVNEFIDCDNPQPGAHVIGYLDFRRDTVVMHCLDIRYMDETGVTLDISRTERLALIGSVAPRTFRDLPLWDFLLPMCSSLEEFTLIQDWEGSNQKNRLASDCSALRLVPIDRELEYIQFDDYLMDLGDWTDFTDFATTAHHLFHNRPVKDVSQWQDVSFNVSLLARFCEERRLIVEEIWLVPTEPEPYDVIYWMRAEYCKPLPSYVYIPTLLFRAIQEPNGELRSPYAGIAELFDE